MTLSNREYEKPSSASSGFDFSRSSWLDFRNFASFDKVGYKISKLDGLISKMKQRDSSIFRKVIMAMQTQDVERARSLSSELLELRKTLRILVDSRNAIELVLTRTTGHVEINESTALPNSSKSDKQFSVRLITVFKVIAKKRNIVLSNQKNTILYEIET